MSVTRRTIGGSLLVGKDSDISRLKMLKESHECITKSKFMFYFHSSFYVHVVICILRGIIPIRDARWSTI